MEILLSVAEMRKSQSKIVALWKHSNAGDELVAFPSVDNLKFLWKSGLQGHLGQTANCDSPSVEAYSVGGPKQHRHLRVAVNDTN